MRAVVQRVRWAEVLADGCILGQVDQGLLVYIGVAVGDTAREAWNLADKVAHLRVFEDPQGKLNLSVQDARGGVLAISDVMHLIDAPDGRGVAYADAADHETARVVFETFVAALRAADVATQQGLFGTTMYIRSGADGPINVVLDVSPAAADLPTPGLAVVSRKNPCAPL